MPCVSKHKGDKTMFSIRNINPMVRAVGTMGAVAALVGGVTFAALQPNQVTLGPNTLTAAATTLAIGPTNCNTTGKTQPGFSSATVKAGAPVSVGFCLDNTSGSTLGITAAVVSAADDSTAITGPEADATTLNLTCDTLGTLSGPLSSFNGVFPSGSLVAGASVNCTATATLSNSYGGNGAAIPTFDVLFTGTIPTET
jgi:hypothetical protein